MLQQQSSISISGEVLVKGSLCVYLYLSDPQTVADVEIPTKKVKTKPLTTMLECCSPGESPNEDGGLESNRDGVHLQSVLRPFSRTFSRSRVSTTVNKQ